MPERRTGQMPVTQMGTDGAPKWVQEMHAHYTTTGAFRVQDVQRVLGDQRTVVGVAANQSLSAAALMSKK